MYNLGSKILAHLSKVDNILKGRAQFPITCEIDPSNYCQNNCKWCIYADYLKRNRIHLDFNLFRSTIIQLKEGGCKSITFTGGGEPLMNPYISAMISLAASYGFQLGLITNGVLLNEIVDQLHHFDFIRVSLDATTTETYKRTKGTNHFDTVCKNIEMVAGLSVVDVGISMVYEDDIKEEAQDFYQLGKRLGVKYSQIKPLVDKDVENASVALKEIKESFVTSRYLVSDTLPCKIAGIIGQVGADGNYYYCCIHRGKPKYKIGNLREKSLQLILQDRMSFDPDLSDCFSCRYMNYAKEYLKVQDEKFQVLRHINFL